MPSLFSLLCATIRFALLAAQAALACGIALLRLMCLRGCGGYGELIWATALGGLAGIISFAALMLHHISNKNRQTYPLLLQPSVQWIWLAVSISVMIVVGT